MSIDDDEALFEDIYGDDDTEPQTKEQDNGNKTSEPSSSSTLDVNPSDSGAKSTTSEVTNTAPSSSLGKDDNVASEGTNGNTISGTSSVPSVSDNNNNTTDSNNNNNSNNNAFPPTTNSNGSTADSSIPSGNVDSSVTSNNYNDQQQSAAGYWDSSRMPNMGGIPPPASFQQPLNPPSNIGKEHGKMFIGGLNWDTTEQGLLDYFSKFGEVIDYTIMRDNATGKSRGFGFLTFRDPRSVDAVINQDHVLDGKLIDPKRAIARDEQDRVGKIFVGGIDPMVNEQEFHDFFSQFGSIIDAQLMIDKDTGRSRGFGFITYDSPDAVDKVTVNKYVSFKGKSMEVKRAEPRGAHNPQQYQPSSQYGYGQGYQQPQFSTNGVSPDMMQEYWQRMQQWYMYQQQQQQGGEAAGGENESAASAPLNPQAQESDQTVPTGPSGAGPRGPSGGFPNGPSGYPSGPGGSAPPSGPSGYDGRRMPPRGPGGNRRGPPSGPSGGRGRGGYRGRDRGEYHPYRRGGGRR